MAEVLVKSVREDGYYRKGEIWKADVYEQKHIRARSPMFTLVLFNLAGICLPEHIPSQIAWILVALK